MSKPKLEEVLELLSLKEKQKALREEISLKVRGIINKHGEGRFDYESTDPKNPDKKFLKIQVSDDLRKQNEGEDVGCFIYFKKESFLVGYNKTKPKVK